MKFYLRFALLALGLVFSGTALAQEDTPGSADGAPLVINLPDDFGIGLIDVQKILQESVAAAAVREEVGTREEGYRTEIEREEGDLRANQDELAQQRGVLSPQEFAVEEAEFRAKVETLQKRVNERNIELQELLASNLRTIQEQIVRIVADLALERNLGLVFDTAVVVIAAEQINISEEVIKRLNEVMPSVDLPKPRSTAVDEESGG